MSAESVAPATAPETPVDRFPVKRFWHAMENRDVEGVIESWTDDVVCKSLGNEQLGFRGKDEARLFVSALLNGCDSFEYTEEIRTHDTLILFLRARFQGLTLHGIDILRINEQGQCTEFAVRVRPYMQASILVGRVAINLTRGGGLVRSLLIRLMIPPLSFAQRIGYRIYNRLTAAALRRQL